MKNIMSMKDRGATSVSFGGGATGGATGWYGAESALGQRARSLRPVTLRSSNDSPIKPRAGSTASDGTG